MKKILNILIILIPIAQAALLKSALFFDGYFFYFIVGTFFLTDILLYLFIPKKTDGKKVFIISFPPLALLLAASAMLFFLEGERAQWLVIGIHTALQLLYGMRMYRFMFQEGYPEIFFTQTVSLVLLVSYFFFSFSFYALIYFLEIPIWYLIVPFLFLTFLFFLIHAWMHDARAREYGKELVACIILIAEALLVIRWLPSLYHVNAFLITVLYFAVVSFGCGSLKKDISRAQKILTVILSVIVVVLVGITAQWR
ncbi:hypothetical protein HYW94_01015 [Candidatus Uhrbacteria bacterium]|nr:hypothetical protein [Candidatus Uhrbacteria bacterium]